MKKLIASLVLAAGFFAFGGTPTFTSPAHAVDFSGKTIQAIVAFREGGGGTFYTRLYLPFFKKYLPGSPKIIVRNMPGGAGIKGSNWFQANATPDGLYYSVVSTSNMTSFVTGGKKVKYNLLKWNYIMLEPLGTVFYTTPSTGVTGKNIKKDVEILRKTKIVAGAKSPTSSELHSFLVFDLLGINNVTPVFGISSGKQRKAILRGEFNFKRDSVLNYLKKVTKYAKKGRVVPFMTLGYDKGGKIVRDPAFPNLPTVVDAYNAVHGKEPSGIAFKTYLHYFNMSVMASKGFALPEGTPKSIVDTYITAAKKIEHDKGFAKKAGKLFGVYPKSYGEDAKNVMRNAVDLSPEARAHVKKFIKNKFNMNI